jgi:hypothetical protein
MTRECRCTAKPLAIDSKFFIVIPGRTHFFHVMVVLLGATAQDLSFSTATCTASWPHSPILLQVLGAEVALVAELPSQQGGPGRRLVTIHKGILPSARRAPRCAHETPSPLGMFVVRWSHGHSRNDHEAYYR